MAFGTIYLGETFCSYISLGNYSAENAVNVTVKVLPGSLKPAVACYFLHIANRLVGDARRSCKPIGKQPRCMRTAPRPSPASHQGSGMTSSSGRALTAPFLIISSRPRAPSRFGLVLLQA